MTRWGERTQLFVEFPALVVGEDSPFAAHLTRLQDHFAIDAGSVVVELSGGGQPIERFSIEGPTQAGIFRPLVRPTAAVRRTVALHLTSVAASESHTLGTFSVFATRAEADAAAPHDHPADGEISYLLEQQWRVPFGVVQAQARSMRPNFSAFAQLERPADASVIITAPRSGRLVAAGSRVPVIGETVAPGDVLFRLTAAPVENADPARLATAVEQAEIRVAAARREVERVEPMATQGVVPQRRLDEARSQLAAAEADLRGARRLRRNVADVQRLGGGSDGVAIPSPIGGVLAELLVAPGSWVSEGDPLARVVDPHRLILNVGVPEAYVGRLGEISGAWFRLPHMPGVFELSAESFLGVAPDVDADSCTLPVRFVVDNVRGELFAGMQMQAYLIADAPVLTTAVPVSALVDDGGTDVVYVQTGGETFVRRPVRLGIRDGEYVEVTEGVAPGEWVVARGPYSVKLASTSTESIGHGHAH